MISRYGHGGDREKEEVKEAAAPDVVLFSEAFQVVFRLRTQLVRVKMCILRFGSWGEHALKILVGLPTSIFLRATNADDTQADACY